MSCFLPYYANFGTGLSSADSENYYPFGMIMSGRSYESGSGYRYGFQGQETDDEMLGGAVSFKFRVHNPRIGRFLSVDPLAGKYPYWGPYHFSGNRVIDAVELEGLELKYVRLVLDTYANGDTYIKRVDDVKINQDLTFERDINGTKVESTLTQIVYNYEGEEEQHLVSIYEPVNYGDADDLLDGLKSSASYNYLDEKDIERKAEDDAAFLANADGYIDLNERMAVLRARDDKAPDHVFETQGINDVLDVLPELAGGKWLFIGKFKLNKDVFHTDIKPNILDAAGRKNFEHRIGKNPNVEIGKDGKILLSGQGDFKGKSYKTDLDPDDFLKQE